MAAYTAPYRGRYSSGRRAALLRAIGGIAARGPELGTDPFGSFQAGLGGALQMGQQQQMMGLQDQERDIEAMRAEAALNRSMEENTNPLLERYAAATGILGRQMNDDEELRFLGLAPPRDPSRVTVAEKIAEAEQALGRKLTPQEANRLAGVYIDPDQDPSTRMTGPAGEIFSYGRGLGFPVGTPDNPNPVGFRAAERAFRNNRARAGAGMTYDPIKRQMIPNLSAGMLTPDMAGLFQVPENGDAMSVWLNAFNKIAQNEELETRGYQAINMAFSTGDAASLQEIINDPNTPGSVRLTAQEYLAALQGRR